MSNLADHLAEQDAITAAHHSPRAAWIVAWTIHHGDNELTDQWAVCASEDEARAQYDAISRSDGTHCATMGQITGATEPHWLDGEV